MAESDTIHAVASGVGRAAISVIRLSGPAAFDILTTLSGQPVPEMRRATLRRLHGEASDVLDEALVLCFAPGAGYTGEASVELHCHGGRAVVQAVLDRLESLGSRHAKPGEFTFRSVLNGRMDLVSAEAVGDLISAETELQRQQAIKGMRGGLADAAATWRDDLVRALALVEVTIDWADEDVPHDVGPEVRQLLTRVKDGIGTQLDLAGRTAQLRHGFEVALVGAPNVGKSSLLNALAGREAAISSPYAGTTRDVIELRYDLDGLPLVFLDMAGLRDTDDPVEALGVERARARAQAADLRLFLTSPGSTEAVGLDLMRVDDIAVWTKADLETGPGDVMVSARSGSGLAELLALLRQRLNVDAGSLGLAGHARQVACLREAHSALEDLDPVLDLAEAEVLAELTHGVVRSLDLLIGRVSVESVLDEVFSTFCLGK